MLSLLRRFGLCSFMIIATIFNEAFFLSLFLFLVGKRHRLELFLCFHTLLSLKFDHSLGKVAINDVPDGDESEDECEKDGGGNKDVPLHDEGKGFCIVLGVADVSDVGRERH